MPCRKFFVVSLVGLMALSACSKGGSHAVDGGPGGDGGPLGMGLHIVPADQVSTLMGTPVVVDYQAFVRAADGSDTDVTASVPWSSTVAALGTFSGNRFTSTTDTGGRTTITATMGSVVAHTSLTLLLSRTIITPGTPADAPTHFGGTPDAAHAPTLIYPDDDTAVPPDLSELEFHYVPGSDTLFDLHFTTPTGALDIYFGCPETVTGGCIYTPDNDTWTAIATAARGQGRITYALRGADGAGHVGESAPRTLTVTQEDIHGGLYYWNAGGGTINRYEFGVRGARAEIFLRPSTVGAFMCVGCHAVSRDGTRIGVDTDTPTTTFQVFDIATRARIFQNGTGGGFPGMPTQPNYYSFNADDSQLVAGTVNGLRFLDGTTGATLSEHVPDMTAASMPDYSPDGNHVVYVRHPGMGVFGAPDLTGVSSGSIERLDWTGSTWVPGPELAPSRGDNNYHPSFSPDGAWVAYNYSPLNTNSVGTDDGMGGFLGVRDAQLWAVAADATGLPFPLTRPGETTNLGGLACSWPKWDPSQYTDQGQPVFWFSWATRRAFGLRLAEDTRMQIWMAAFRPADAAAGRPAVYNAFHLPFQDLDSGNHIAQWVTTVMRLTCSTDVDCGGEFCVDGRCYQQRPLI